MSLRLQRGHATNEAVYSVYSAVGLSTTPEQDALEVVAVHMPFFSNRVRFTTSAEYAPEMARETKHPGIGVQSMRVQVCSPISI